MTINTIPTVYFVLILATISTIGLFISSFIVKTRESLSGILWGLLATLGLWIAPWATIIILDSPIGLEIIFGFIAGILSAIVMIVTLIIVLVKRKKRENSDATKKQLWLFAYIIPIGCLIFVSCVDVATAKNANIIVEETCYEWLSPSSYYAINQTRSTLLGVSPKIATKESPDYLSFEYLDMDYSSAQFPNLKWTTMIDTDITAEQIPFIIQDTYNIMLSDFVQRETINEYNPEIFIADINNTGYYYVSICKDTETVKAIFYKDCFVTETDMDEPKTVYIIN